MGERVESAAGRVCGRESSQGAADSAQVVDKGAVRAPSGTCRGVGDLCQAFPHGKNEPQNAGSAFLVSASPH